MKYIYGQFTTGVVQVSGNMQQEKRVVLLIKRPRSQQVLIRAMRLYTTLDRADVEDLLVSIQDVGVISGFQRSAVVTGLQADLPKTGFHEPGVIGRTVEKGVDADEKLVLRNADNRIVTPSIVLEGIAWKCINVRNPKRIGGLAERHHDHGGLMSRPVQKNHDVTVCIGIVNHLRVEFGTLQSQR